LHEQNELVPEPAMSGFKRRNDAVADADAADYQVRA